MPDQIRDVTRFSRYFNIQTPSCIFQAILLVVLAMVAGITANLVIHQGSASLYQSLLSGISLGTIMITIPGILTVIFIKATKRRMRLKHAFFGVLAPSSLYSLFFIANALLFAITRNYVLAYSVLILANALIYGYWLLVNRIVLGQKKSRIFTSAFQPVLNVLFFIPLGAYLFNAAVPLGAALLKLWSGMAVFLVIGYLILYTMDRPAKKALKISSVEILTAMVSQWLYDMTKDVEIFSAAGTKRAVNTDILALKGRKGLKAVFVSPDIHYGPFHAIGGGIATESIGRRIEKSTGAVPFIMHGAVSIEDNPISTRQIYGLSDAIARHVASVSDRAFKNASGSIYTGKDGPCRAIGITIGDSCILTLSKAPRVTEDIEKPVGIRLAGLASKRFGNVMLVDAHNSRIESANAGELRGIHRSSRYIARYENAIRQMRDGGAGRSALLFGSYAERLSEKLHKRDLGEGYTSVGIFKFGKRRFCMIYFDANNMLPSFRREIIRHVKARLGADAELYTTDTHSVNTIALPASNVLGRETRPNEIIPILDSMLSKAMGNLEAVRYVHTSTKVEGFKVWGRGTEDELLRASREAILAGKRKVPIIIAVGFIIAAWVIYLT